LLERFGLLEAGNAELTPRRLAVALEAAIGRPVQQLVHWSALRSMQQARYSTESLGHYALGFEHYLHFTSPIRRVADLAVHRALHRVLCEQAQPGDALQRAERVAVRASLCERVAQRVEREARAIKRAALMEARLGECFDGHISGLIEGALFVTLDDPFVDGRLDASELGSQFALEPDGLALVARRSRRRLALGDPISVRVEAVDAFRGQVSFGAVRRR
jgi:ribonuclease R